MCKSSMSNFVRDGIICIIRESQSWSDFSGSLFNLSVVECIWVLTQDTNVFKITTFLFVNGCNNIEGKLLRNVTKVVTNWRIMDLSSKLFSHILMSLWCFVEMRIWALILFFDHKWLACYSIPMGVVFVTGISLSWIFNTCETVWD